MGLYIGPTYEVQGDCLRTSTRMETKGICLCKQATNVEDSPRTIVIYEVVVKLVKFNFFLGGRQAPDLSGYFCKRE